MAKAFVESILRQQASKVSRLDGGKARCSSYSRPAAQRVSCQTFSSWEACHQSNDDYRSIALARSQVPFNVEEYLRRFGED